MPIRLPWKLTHASSVEVILRPMRVQSNRGALQARLVSSVPPVPTTQIRLVDSKPQSLEAS